MKNILFYILLLFSFSCSKSADDNNKTGETVLVYPLIVMTKDLGVFTWGEANNACTALGPGWRLPTDLELKHIFNNHDKIGNFAISSYWSSTENSLGTASTINYPSYIQTNQSKLFPNHVRAVKTY